VFHTQSGDSNRSDYLKAGKNGLFGKMAVYRLRQISELHTYFYEIGFDGISIPDTHPAHLANKINL